MRALLAVAGITVALSTYVVSAAGLSITSRSIGSGAVTLPSCASDVTPTEVVSSGGVITSLSVKNVAASCAGGSVAVTINDGHTITTATATVGALGGTVTVTVPGSLAITDTATIATVVKGP